MNWREFQFPFTGAAIVISLLVLAAAYFGHIDLFVFPDSMMGHIQQSEVDEIVSGFLLIGVAQIIDHRILAKRRLELQSMVETDRLRVIQMTIRTVQDTVGNCLNQMQLLRLDAEGHVPQESLTIFDQSVEEISGKLTALGSIQKYAEKQMAVGTGLDETLKA